MLHRLMCVKVIRSAWTNETMYTSSPESWIFFFGRDRLGKHTPPGRNALLTIQSLVIKIQTIEAPSPNACRVTRYVLRRGMWLDKSCARLAPFPSSLKRSHPKNSWVEKAMSRNRAEHCFLGFSQHWQTEIKLGDKCPPTEYGSETERGPPSQA